MFEISSYSGVDYGRLRLFDNGALEILQPDRVMTFLQDERLEYWLEGRRFLRGAMIRAINSVRKHARAVFEISWQKHELGAYDGRIPDDALLAAGAISAPSTR
jgi:hypothetical protein